MRFTTNPGPSCTSTGVFPNFFDSSIIVSFTAAGVLMPEITSTNFILSAGLKKCIPITLCLIPFAISVTDKDDVFVAKIVESLQISSKVVKSVFFASLVSKIASITKSLSFKSLYSPVFKFPFTDAAVSAAIFPFVTSLSRFAAILSIPDCAHSIFISQTVTS